MSTYRNEYPNSLTSGEGLISSLSRLSSIPWNVMDDEQVKSIEQLYSMRSGFKDLCDSFLLIPIAERPQVIAAMYAQKWSRIFSDYAIEYNVLDAYSMTETGNRKKEITQIGETKYGRSVNEQGSDTGTVDNTDTDSVEATGSVYGFNSINPVPSAKDVESNTTIGKETRNLTNTRSTTNSGQDGTENNEEEEENYSYTKSGNIGYTTPQELIRQSLQLWQKPFFDIVFSDIDRIIALSVY